MQISYIILAHGNPLQLKRLVDRLNSGNVSFYIHIDLKIDDAEFRQLLPYPNVYFVESRVDVLWGHISQVYALLNAMQLYLKHEREGHAILLSGLDYPLKSNRYIANFLQHNASVDFLDYFALPDHRWKEGGMNRIHSYRIGLSERDGKRQVKIRPCSFQWRNLSRLIVALLVHPLKALHILKLFFTMRKHPDYIQPYGGSFWWILKHDSVQYIDNFIRNHPAYLDFHKYTSNPDEIIFPSILCSDISLLKNIKKDTWKYADWENKQESPKTFILKDEEQLKDIALHEEGILFARKFDETVDAKILDQLDIILSD